MTKLFELINNIKNKFLCKKAIVSSEEIFEMMLNYKSNPNDWKSLVVKHKNRYGQRLLNPEPLESIKIILCNYQPDQKTKIHNHSNSNCIIKVLQGRLTENHFYVKNHDKNDKSELVPSHKLILNLNECSHMQGLDKFHNVSNDEDLEAISLQIYWRPYTQYLLYDEKKGHLMTKITPFKFSGEHSVYLKK